MFASQFGELPCLERVLAAETFVVRKIEADTVKSFKVCFQKGFVG